MEKKEKRDEFERHKSLIYGKLVDKTLSDMDYSELAEEVYGKKYASDVARKMMYGSRFTLQLLDEAGVVNVTDEDIFSEMDVRTIDLKKEQKKLADQRREFNKLVASQARGEHLSEELIKCAKNLSDKSENVYKDFYGELSVNYNNPNTEAILVLSDWHYGLKTENIFNKYDTEICKERVKTVVLSTAQKMVLHECSKLHVVVLGDLIHGAIHIGARVASEELVCDQLMHASELLAQSIEFLSQYVEEVVVHVTYGNHARTIANKEASIHRDNMERLVPWWLEQRFASKGSITVAPDTGNEFLFIDVCGHSICAVHGDNDTVKSAPQMLSTLCHKKLGKNIEYVLLGDKHHIESFNELGVTALLCGSVCGTDDYANGKRLYSDASQLLLIANPKNGVDAQYRLKCE